MLEGIWKRGDKGPDMEHWTNADGDGPELAPERNESSLRTVHIYTWLHKMLLKISSRTKIRSRVEVSRSGTN